MTRSTALLALGGLLCLSACDERAPTANARRVTHRADLIGGPSALGEVGDYLLENDKIRVVIQDTGFSRGFGVYGGGLIDADRVRPATPGGPSGGLGRDGFGELFPIFFLQALEPDQVEVLADGSDGGPARVRVSGSGADFLSLTKALNRALLNSHELEGAGLTGLFDVEGLSEVPQLAYEIVYELAPDTRYVRLTTKMTNITDGELALPLPDITRALGSLTGIDLSGFQVPVGSVVLFGAGNDVFAPGVGYDIRFALEESYQTPVPFPALAGILSRGLISTSHEGVSYGYFALPDPKVENFAKARLDADGNSIYEQAYGVTPEDDHLLVPFLASAFTGVFYAQAPNLLAAGESFEYSTYFVVGDGDAASVLDVVHELRGEKTGTLVGHVADLQTATPVEGASVLVYETGKDAAVGPVNQLFADRWGRFQGSLPPGTYSLRVADGPGVSAAYEVTIRAGEGSYVALGRPLSAHISAHVRDAAGWALPAKVTVVGTYAAEHVGEEPRKFLFDLAAGQSWRTNDLVPDQANEPASRRYIEAHGYTEDGRLALEVRPGTYEIYVSRGPEYDLHRETVTVEPGSTASVSALLTRVVDTAGYVSADFHIHAAPSLDSHISLHDRVVTGAGEGLEVLTATDHNFVTDYRPYIERAGLAEWMTSIVGLELTTLESGHFNGFPLRRDISQITRGSFEWSERTPDALFTELRALGEHGPDNTIVQVNHPRDTILGYFAQYEVDGLTGEVVDLQTRLQRCGASFGCKVAAQLFVPNGPAFVDEEGNSTFSYAFDAMEVLNGSVLGQRHHERMPEDVEGRDIPDPVRARLPGPGDILCEGGEVAFPGAIDDWFNMLNLGHRYIGTANSDSHHDDEIGYPRTYLYVGHDDPAKVSSRDVVDALKSRRVLMTNGPFVELTVEGRPMGSEVKARDGRVTVAIEVRTAPWIDVDRAVLYANGEVVAEIDVQLKDGRFRWQDDVELPRDAWLVAEVTGDDSLFPIVKPIDVPPVLLSDAFGAITGPLGLGGSVLGGLQPPRTEVWKPIALTNPIWVDVDGEGFTAPGPLPRACRNYAVVSTEQGQMKSALREEAPIRRLPLLNPSLKVMPRIRGDLRDVRTIFEHFSSHSH